MRETEGGESHTEKLAEADAFVPAKREKKNPVPVKLLQMTIFEH